jgi:hypothetical protein
VVGDVVHERDEPGPLLNELQLRLLAVGDVEDHAVDPGHPARVTLRTPAVLDEREESRLALRRRRRLTGSIHLAPPAGEHGLIHDHCVHVRDVDTPISDRRCVDTTDRASRRHAVQINGTDGMASEWLERAAHQRAIGAERSAADADQTASDADQTASERDEADAISDQLVADLEQARAGRGLPLESVASIQEHDAARVARDATRVSRLATRGARAETAGARLRGAGDRDSTAAARDDMAVQRDLRAEALEHTVAASDAPDAEKLEWLRLQAAGDRARAAADRARAAQDRIDAAHERARLESALGEATGAWSASSSTSTT